MTFKNSSLIKFTLVFSFSIITFRAITIPATDRKTLYGDGYSDENTYSAILYFKDHGFMDSYLLPMQNYTKTRKKEDAIVYSHYPALPDIFSGFYAYIFNTEDEKIIRIIPIILSGIMCYFVWLTLNMLISNKLAVTISFISLLLSNYFISFADNLHKHIYEEFFKWGFVLLILSFYLDKKYLNKSLMIALLGIITFLASNASFEPIVYIAVATVGFSFIFQKKIFTPLNFILGAATILGFLAHVYQNSLYFGSLDAAIADLTGSLSHRTLGKDNPKNYFTALDFFFNFFRPFNRLERMFLIPGWAYLFFGYFSFKKIKNEHHQFFKISIVLLLASYSWSLFMPQHAFVHPFTIRQFGIFITLITGYIVIIYKDYLKVHFKTLPMSLKALHGFMLFYTSVMILTQHILPVYIKYGFFNHFFPVH